MTSFPAPGTPHPRVRLGTDGFRKVTMRIQETPRGVACRGVTPRRTAFCGASCRPAGDERPIVIKGAREHNLKNLDLVLPRNAFIVVHRAVRFRGSRRSPSTPWYAEGQRRYVESACRLTRGSSWGRWRSPTSTALEGCRRPSPSQQRTAAHNPRSTVGTTTEIHDYLRLSSQAHRRPALPPVRRRDRQQTIAQMVEQVLRLPLGTRVLVLAPIVRGRKGEHRKLIDGLAQQGFVRMRVNGEVLPIDADVKLARNKKHTIEAVVDRLSVDPRAQRRLADSLETAVRRRAAAWRWSMPAAATCSSASCTPRGVRHLGGGTRAAHVLVQQPVTAPARVQRARQKAQNQPRAPWSRIPRSRSAAAPSRALGALQGSWSATPSPASPESSASTRQAVQAADEARARAAAVRHRRARQGALRERPRQGRVQRPLRGARAPARAQLPRDELRRRPPVESSRS